MEPNNMDFPEPERTKRPIIIMNGPIPGPTARRVYMVCSLTCLGFVIAALVGWNAPRAVFVCLSLILCLETFSLWAHYTVQAHKRREAQEELIRQRRADLN